MAPLALVIIVFAVANRGPVILDGWPLPFTIEVPAFLLLYAGVLIGLVFGVVIGWMSAAESRRQARVEAARAVRAERDRRQLESRIARLATDAGEQRPALPPRSDVA